MKQELWEILVPTVKPEWMPGKNRHFTTKYHRQWDAQVVAIAKGLTILEPGKGRWVSPGGELFKERMIPVRVGCTKDQIKIIMDLVAKHYGQIAVMAYKVSDEVLIQHYHQGEKANG